MWIESDRGTKTQHRRLLTIHNRMKIIYKCSSTRQKSLICTNQQNTFGNTFPNTTSLKKCTPNRQKDEFIHRQGFQYVRVRGQLKTIITQTVQLLRPAEIYYRLNATRFSTVSTRHNFENTDITWQLRC